MTKSFNVGDLAKLAKNILNKQENGQDFMLYDVYQQTRAAYERFPEDPVIRQVAFVIEKMTEKAPQGKTISQANLSQIYNQFIRLSGNSKFRAVLGHLLNNDIGGSLTNESFVKANRVDAEDSGIVPEDFMDKELINSFNSALGVDVEIKAYNQKLAEKGREYVELELISLGFNHPRVEILGGDKDTLIYNSHFDSVNGLVSIAIPIDLKDGQVVLPSCFIAGDQLENLNAANINSFIDKKAKERNPNIDRRAETLNSDMALNLDHIIDTRKVEMPKELAHLARDFEDSLIESASSFGMSAISEGKLLVARELLDAGFKNAQVKFGSESNDSVIYLASINTPRGPVEIEVPVEMQSVANKHIPLVPTYFAYDGLVEDFNAAKLQRFAISMPAPSTRNTVCESSYSYMLLPELKDEILKSASENDYVACETILNYIEDKFSEEDHKNAIADYQYLLMAKANMHKEQHICSRMIAAGKGSSMARCGHYLVSMDKVIAGKNGECILKTSAAREKLNPIDVGGAAISTSKINFT